MKYLILIFLLIPSFFWAQLSNYSNVIYVSPNTESGLNSRQLDVNLAVGSLEGNTGVSNGSPIYNVPLNVAPGLFDLQPDLSVNYVLNSGNSALGLNWHLNGLSSIIRTSLKNKINTQSYAIGANTDYFELDGQLLIAKNNSTEYGTQEESFNKITYSGAQDNPTSFLVETKKGIFMEYGNFGNSKVTSPMYGTSKTIIWKINKIYDRHGNYMLFEYENINNENFIKRIKYTGNSTTNLLPYNELMFEYKQRTDKTNEYFQGVKIGHSLLIDKITCYTHEVAYKQYSFNYFYDGFHSILAEIKVCGSDLSTYLNATKFSYGRGTDFNSIRVSATNLFTDGVYQSFDNSFGKNLIPKIIGDFNGDGLTDIICLFSKYEPRFWGYSPSGELIFSEIQSYTSYALFLKNEVGDDFTFSGNYSFKEPVYIPSSVSRSDKQRQILLPVMDVNHDGKDDIIVFEQIDQNNFSRDIMADVLREIYHNNSIDLFTPIRMAFRLAYTYVVVRRAFLSNPNNANFEIVSSNTKLKNIVTIDVMTGNELYRVGSIAADKNFKAFNYTLGDFNGNGTPDMIYTGVQDDAKWSQNNKLGLFCTAYFYEPYNGATGAHSRVKMGNGFFQDTFAMDDEDLFPIKLNNDKTTDLCYNRCKERFFNSNDYFKLSAFQVKASSTNEITLEQKYIKWVRRSIPNNMYVKEDVRPADFNGDGLTDLLVGGNIYTGIGNSFTINQLQTEQYPPVTDSYLSDFNHDGLTDVLWIFRDPPRLFRQLVYFISNGDASFSIVRKNISHIKHPLNPANAWQTYLEDDPRMDELYLIKGHFDNKPGEEFLGISDGNVKYAMMFDFKLTDKPYALQTISDGLNNRIKFEYESMVTTGLSAVYSGRYYSYPYVTDMHPNILMVKSLKQFYANGETHELQYRYANQMVNVINNQRGFEYLDVDDLTMDRTEKTTNGIVFPGSSASDFSSIVKINETSKIKSSSSLLSSTDFNYAAYYKDNFNRSEIQLNSINSLDGVQGTSVTQVNSYDGFGNITWTQKNINEVLEIESVQTIFEKGPNWIESLPSKVTTIKSRGNEPGYVFEETNVWNNTNGSLEKTTKFSDKPKKIETSFSYNNLGCITQKVTSSAGLPSLTETFDYDVTGRAVTTTTNPAGQSRSTTYHPVWNLPTSESDFGGNTVLSDYNPFGQISSNVTSDNESISINTSWDIKDKVFSAAGKTVKLAYKTTIIPQAHPKVETWFDSKGRSIVSTEEAFGGKIKENYTLYNSKNQLEYKSVPFFSNDDHELLKNTYDSYGRILKEEWLKNSIITNYQYSASNGIFTITKTEPNNRVSSQDIDASQKQVATTDLGGKINYSYNSAGNIININHDGKLITSFAYDEYEKKIKESDIGSGLSTKAYNLYDQLVSESDSRSLSTFSYSYNLLGQIIAKTTPTCVYTYSYETSGKATNNLKEVTSSLNNFSTTYNYDPNTGRLSSYVERIDGELFGTSFSYNQYGSKTFQGYPYGYGVYFTYDSKNRLTRVSDIYGKHIYTPSTYNAFDQVTSYNLGRLATSNCSYSNIGLPTSSTSPVHNWSYTFDPLNQDLKSRRNNPFNFLENFDYDQLDRLTTSSATSLVPANVVYDKYGNITTKTDAGALNYNTYIGHAVTEATNTPYNIPLSRQDIKYNAFRQPSEIKEGDNVVRLEYGEDGERRVMETIYQNKTKSIRYYQPSFERTYYSNHVNSSLYHDVNYVYADGALRAINVRSLHERPMFGKPLIFIGLENQGQVDPSSTIQQRFDSLYYVYTDYLGSIKVVVDESNNLVANRHFDAWGREVSLLNRTYLPDNNRSDLPLWLYRGYTEHEHLYNFGLINMNGRLYDPILGRMCQSDAYTQIGLGSQGYNRFSYAGNNPLKYTDPSGESLYDRWSRTFHADGRISVEHISDEGGNDWDYIENFDESSKTGWLSAQKVNVNTAKGINGELPTPARTEPGSRTYFQSTDPAIHSADPIFDMISLGGAAKASFAALKFSAKWAFPKLFVVGVGDDAARVAIERAGLNRLNHIFGKSEHALENLVTKFGSQEGAFNAVQNTANQALNAGKLTPNAKGILPSGDLGNIINVGGMDVRLIGGKVENGQVILSSFSRKGF